MVFNFSAPLFSDVVFESSAVRVAQLNKCTDKSLPPDWVEYSLLRELSEIWYIYSN